jgi:hypothetical protein
MSESAPEHHPDYIDPSAEDSEEALTMQQRIQAFYRQSGGPGVPEIQKFFEHHLRYGTDHGVPGHKETLEDVFSSVVRNDKSLMTLFQLYNRWQADREEKEEQRRQPDAVAELSEKITRLEGRLEGEIRSLRELLAEVLRDKRLAADSQKADEQ